MNIVRVEASKTYDILIEKDLLERAGKIIHQSFGQRSLVIITDDIVDNLYGIKLEKALKEEGFSTLKHVIAHGEESKSANNYIDILNFLAKEKITRSDIIVALGGGVVGDLAGFVAASFLRGIKLVQIPTSLLAQVDSSVGGKTAINLKEGKNLVGAFYQPDLVLIDYTSLNTLQADTFSDGMAEVIKYGILKDKKLFELAKDNKIREHINRVIYECVSIKRDIVNEDELDLGQRQLLNLGHTFGHAIEKASNFKISHGQAVAMGMVIAAKASYSFAFSKEDLSKEIARTLETNGLETKSPFSADELIGAALSDKKRQGDKINLILPLEIGRCIIHTIDTKDLVDYFKAGLEG